MMRFDKVSVESQAAFDPARRLTRKGVYLGCDLPGKLYARLDLPSTKTAKPGEIQSAFLVTEGLLCPIAALCNLASAVSALPNDPLFSWQDSAGEFGLWSSSKPSSKSTAPQRRGSILLPGQESGP
jgi:hypothetical protein